MVAPITVVMHFNFIYMTSISPVSDGISRDAIEREIRRRKLPAEFMTTVDEYYRPLAEKVIERANCRSNSKPILLGIQGSQGSGKSTCAAFLKLLFEKSYTQKTLAISIDDFYLRRSERRALASDIHPLFVTRGVPGTHDLALLLNIVQSCNDPEAMPLWVPVFDKATDNRARQADWQMVAEPVDIVILEGWCVGLSAQDEEDLAQPINELEAVEDFKQHWRRYVNRQLDGTYADFYAKLDYLVALQAPSFECVYEWRALQEQKLLQSLTEVGEDIETKNILSPQALTRFIAHYERLTRHALATMPQQADWLLMLNADHSFSKLVDNVEKQ